MMIGRPSYLAIRLPYLVIFDQYSLDGTIYRKISFSKSFCNDEMWLCINPMLLWRPVELILEKFGIMLYCRYVFNNFYLPKTKSKCDTCEICVIGCKCKI